MGEIREGRYMNTHNLGQSYPGDGKFPHKLYLISVEQNPIHV